MGLRLKVKIPLLMVGVVVALVLFILSAVSDIVNEATSQNLAQELNEAKSAVKSFQELRTRDTKLVASLPFFKATLRTKDPASILQLATALKNKIGNDLFIITDEAGNLLARTDGAEGDDSTSHPVIRAALEEKTTTGVYTLDDTVYQITGIPVLLRGRVAGTITVGFRINDIHMKQFNTVSKSETSFILDHRLIASAWTGEKRNQLAQRLEGMSSAERFVLDQAEGAFEWTIDGNQYIGTHVSLGKNNDGKVDGYYLMLLSKDKFTAFLGTIQRTIMVPGVIVGLITAFISFLLLQQILVPIGKLMKASQSIASGHFDFEPIKVNKSNEVGVLVQSFSVMVDGLRKADRQQKEFIKTLTQTAESVAGAADALTASSEKMSLNTEKVSRQADNVSLASKYNDESIQTVTRASEGIFNSTKEISSNVNNATEMTTRAVDMVKNANTIIARLDKSSMKIDEVVRFINSIAEQTNLLALNATIEAARAGEAGKGFAVVANEVKDLANETAKATEEISKQISALQIDAKASVSEISGIGEIVARINEVSKTISSSVGEQSSMISEISHNISEVAEGSREVVDSIEKVSSVSKSSKNEGQTVLNASKHLAKMGSDLIEVVEKLKIDLNSGKNI